jgi:hypothetical protein
MLLSISIPQVIVNDPADSDEIPEWTYLAHVTPGPQFTISGGECQSGRSCGCRGRCQVSLRE